MARRTRDQTKSSNPRRDSEGKLVRVQFYDPSEFDSRFHDGEDPIECNTVGWILGSNDKFLKLAWIIDNCDEGDYSGLTIPRGCIKQVHVMAEPHRRGSEGGGR
jgi:hypothetical protein